MKAIPNLAKPPTSTAPTIRCMPIGSAIALLVFTLVTAAHFRVRAETGASTLVLSVAITSTVVVLLTCAFTTLVDEPATAVTLAVILLSVGVGLDLGWKRIRDGRIPLDEADATTHAGIGEERSYRHLGACSGSAGRTRSSTSEARFGVTTVVQNGVGMYRSGRSGST